MNPINPIMSEIWFFIKYFIFKNIDEFINLAIEISFQRFGLIGNKLISGANKLLDEFIN